MKSKCEKVFFLLRVSQSIADYFGSQLETIARKRTRERIGKKQIKKIVINAKTRRFVSRGSNPKNVRPVEEAMKAGSFATLSLSQTVTRTG
jgi:hypothetical protein